MTRPDQRAGALAQRLAALLCFTAAVLFGITAAIASRLTAARTGDDFRLPGHATLDPAATTVLLVCTAAFAICGVVLLVLTPTGLPAMRLHGPAGRRPLLVLLLGGAALLAALLLRRFGS